MVLQSSSRPSLRQNYILLSRQTSIVMPQPFSISLPHRMSIIMYNGLLNRLFWSNELDAACAPFCSDNFMVCGTVKTNIWKPITHSCPPHARADPCARICYNLTLTHVKHRNTWIYSRQTAHAGVPSKWFGRICVRATGQLADRCPEKDHAQQWAVHARWEGDATSDRPARVVGGQGRGCRHLEKAAARGAAPGGWLPSGWPPSWQPPADPARFAHMLCPAAWIKCPILPACLPIPNKSRLPCTDDAIQEDCKPVNVACQALQRGHATNCHQQALHNLPICSARQCQQRAQPCSMLASPQQMASSHHIPEPSPARYGNCRGLPLCVQCLLNRKCLFARVADICEEAAITRRLQGLPGITDQHAARQRECWRWVFPCVIRQDLVLLKCWQRSAHAQRVLLSEQKATGQT